MKKKLALMVLVLFVLAPMVALAQTWYTANQATVAWDPVPPVATGDTIKYQVYTRVGTTGTPVKVGNEITATQLAITFSVEGRYYVGVDAVRYPSGETAGIRSATISWSSNAADCSSAGPFGIVFYVAPAAATGLRNVP